VSRDEETGGAVSFNRGKDKVDPLTPDWWERVDFIFSSIEGDGTTGFLIARNNISEVTLNWGASHAVVQSLWWRTSLDPQADGTPPPIAARSVFTVSLDLDDPAYPKPTVAVEA